ncbi:hypothetical protein HanXRQr2_Chr13g0585761 [Helianthus annuus]|uniref:Uncharacterized protein n=1 Tax=Helianthus annuus TaxID=4232 RepID=A0A9K3EH58_HELAN|nr:hypothetical protein HanXRQr2_Chr13g0585761 [Helianthus annuus]KAJ0849001.1 hypothetical protein HanPSC8_Chr13g0563931 [Helianthus annuus]
MVKRLVALYINCFKHSFQAFWRIGFTNQELDYFHKSCNCK